MTGLEATIGVFVLVFIFGGILAAERYMDKRRAKTPAAQEGKSDA